MRENLSSKNWPFFVVLGARVRVLTTINVCHFNANIAFMNIKDVNTVKSGGFFFYVHVEMPLCLHQPFILTLAQFLEFLM